MGRLATKWLCVAVCLCVPATGCAPKAETGTAPVGVATLPADQRTNSPQAVSRAPAPAQLSPHGKDVLVRARRDGVTRVVLVISTDTGATERTATALRELGAVVEAADASVGYLRASVALDDVQRAVAAEGVRQVDVEEPLSATDPTP
ncbi:hypothetical protein [Saccharothrix australiensis]|uniref:Peptidase inhibitor I9 n=1 Tax=Saccharothrix australiensis TaxID=2072 RepID=A0A495W8A8_9PSEU|nr:hypothetical protein [Saccharothrix australiensis]RKT57367.1 hypothetical protein C8E97_6087 [Saccharothrix australiensis]